MAVKYYSIDPRPTDGDRSVAEGTSAPTSVVIATIDTALTPLQAIFALEAIIEKLGKRSYV